MKKIIVFGPALPRWNEIDAIKKSLYFLSPDYSLSFLDPLADAIVNPSQVTNYRLWRDRIKAQMNDCVAFIGFSFGGVILRHCFELFNQIKKTIILLSVPEKIDITLQEQLSKIIAYAEQGNADLAMKIHQQSIFFPSQPTSEYIFPEEKSTMCKRLSVGLQAVLNINNHCITHPIKHLSLVGEKSKLVNINHIQPSVEGRCVIVPKAGMRVLQDNPLFCQSIIMDELHGNE